MFIGLLAAIALQAAPVTGEPEAADATTEAPAKVDMPTRVTTDGKEDLEVDKQNAGALVCKRFVDTGSRISNRKVCKTAAEWEDLRLENADMMRTKRGAAGGPQPGNGG